MFAYNPLRSIFGVIFLLCSFHFLGAQNVNQDICKEGDCPDALFAIELEEPSKAPGNTFSKSRTDNIIQAYQSFQQLKSNYAQASAWKAKYEGAQLGGKNCIRHYQLESYFAHEYVQNPDFKAFVDKQGGSSPSFVEDGFQASKRGLNLKARMQNFCSRKVKEVEEADGPKLEELSDEFMRLGKEQGYFDKDGNLIKPIDPPSSQTNTAPQNLSKKKQVEQLKQRVANLPINQQTEDQIKELSEDLNKAKPRAQQLLNVLTTVVPIVAALIAPQIPLIAGIGKAVQSLAKHTNWKPKIQNNELVNKIKDLFNKGKKLKDKADAVLGQSNSMQDKFNELKNKAEKLQQGIDDKSKEADELHDLLADLKKKKEELEAKLADKPKKMIEELNQSVDEIEKKAQELKDNAGNGLKAKDQLLKELEDLEKKKDELLAEKDRIQKVVDQITTDNDQLQTDTDAVNKQVEAAKKQENNLNDMAQSLDQLPSAENLKESLVICEEDLKRIFTGVEPAQQAQDAINNTYNKVADKPKKLLDKIKNLKLFQEKLKIPKRDIPVAEKSLKKIDGLLSKASALASVAEALTGKKSKIQTRIEQLDNKLEEVKDLYENRDEALAKLGGDLTKLIDEKTDLKQKIDQAVGQADDMEKAYQDFVDKFNLFEKESACVEQEELEEKLKELKKEQEASKEELDDFGKEVDELDKDEQALQEETDQLEELIDEETKLKQTLGNDVSLEPVTAEEWAESFEVKRDYWDAVFHPDDEVVTGFKGRYFLVRFKDAEKKVKLLFGPGEYYMSKGDFRDNYGSVIGAFVTEALIALKKSDQGNIKLFVQGSADITGANTFRGNLDEKFFYEEVDVLPYVPSSDGFASSPVKKTIPKTRFTNEDLPDLRGNFLKEMISVYSKKLVTIQLEGSVTKKVNKDDRNAIIYLFIPEELVEAYGG